MPQLSKVIKVIPLKTAWKKDLPLAVKPLPSFVNNKPTEQEQTRPTEEKQITTGKTGLPEQPQGYIKCPVYDFF